MKIISEKDLPVINSVLILVILALMLFLFKKRNTNYNTQIIPTNQTQQPNAETQTPSQPQIDEPITKLVLNIPKQPVNINNSLKIMCPKMN